MKKDTDMAEKELKKVLDKYVKQGTVSRDAAEEIRKKVAEILRKSK